MQGYLIIGIIFALIVAIFSIQNAVPVSLSFFNWHFDTSLVVVILGAIALGVLAMGAFSTIQQFRLKRKLNKLKKSNEELKQANKDLADQLSRIHESKKEKEDNSYKYEFKEEE